MLTNEKEQVMKSKLDEKVNKLIKAKQFIRLDCNEALKMAYKHFGKKADIESNGDGCRILLDGIVIGEDSTWENAMAGALIRAGKSTSLVELLVLD